MKNIVWPLIFLTLIPIAVVADDWKTTLFSEDSVSKYYVCIGEDEKSEATAIDRATDECYRTAIADNFGIQTEISQQTLETDFSTQIRVRKNLQSDRIKLNSFSRTHVELSFEKNQIKAFVRYKFDKAAIAQEKSRLLTLVPQAPGSMPSNFQDELGMMSSSGDISYNTSISVQTNPSRARILLNGDPIGYSDLRLTRMIRPGEYKLTIEKEGYDDIEEAITVTENKPVQIRRDLQKRKIRIHFKIEPREAQLFINGKLQKTHFALVEYGSEIRVKATNENCADLEIPRLRIQVLQDMVKDLKLICYFVDEQDLETNSRSEVSESPMDRIKTELGTLNLTTQFAIGIAGNYHSASLSSNDAFTLSGGGIGLEAYLRVASLYVEFGSHSYLNGALSSRETPTSSMRSDKPVAFNSRRIKIGMIEDTSSTDSFGLALFQDAMELERPMAYYADSGSLSSIERKRFVLREAIFYGCSFDFFSKSQNGNSLFKLGFSMGLSTPNPSGESSGFFGLGFGYYFGSL